MMKRYSRCLRCGKLLKNEECKQLGYGKICYKKMQVDQKKRPLFKLK